MSYLVLARKYRPQAFDDVTGQEHVVQTLGNAIAHDRVAHAFLLCGPRGVGKTTTARLLARALNCASGPTATPCGTCQACREIVAGSSVDVVEIDGASNNGVDNVRELREAARYMPQRERMVSGSFCGSVVAKMNFTCGGGSSSVLSSALNAATDSMCTSSMMKTLCRSRCGM